MSAYRFVTLTCDICGDVWDEDSTNSIRDARRTARRQGWVCIEHGNRDECPVHHGWDRHPMGFGYMRSTPPTTDTDNDGS